MHASPEGIYVWLPGHTLPRHSASSAQAAAAVLPARHGKHRSVAGRGACGHGQAGCVANTAAPGYL
jgi:hypothetical protein